MRQQSSAPILSRLGARGILGLVALLVLEFRAVPSAAQVGTLDPSFGTGGIVVTDLGAVDRARAVLVQSDGAIVVVGMTGGLSPAQQDAVVLRYGPDGSLLNTLTYFEVPFCGTAPEELWAIKEQDDGKLVVGGVAQFGCSGLAERDFWLWRLEPNGTGGQRFDRPQFYGNYDEARDLALQDDGRVVAVGVAGTSTSVSTWDFAVARFNSDLSLDTVDFGTDGEVVVDFFGERDTAQGVALQPDGKIVVAGFATDSGQTDIALVRLLPNGALDPMFGTGGMVTTDVAGFDDGANDVLVLPGGAIVVAGWRTLADGVSRDHVAVRYLSDGSLDPTFGVGGLAVADFGPWPAAASRVLLQYDGKLVLAGWAETGTGGIETRRFAVARFDADGVLDPTFAGDGKTMTDVVAGQQDLAADIALQPNDGHLVVVGYTVEESGADLLYDAVVTRLIGDAALLIFGDGFESGDTSMWGP